MAQRVTTELVDDTDGTPAAETVRFGCDGMTYVIDLSVRNAAALRTTMAPYQAAARKSGRPPRRRVLVDADPTTVRAWASANGITLSPRGRLSAEVVARFHAAGN